MKQIYQLGLAASTLLLFMAKNALDCKRRMHEVPLPAVKRFEPIDLLFISDIHRRRIPEKMMEEKADVVLIGGDLLEGGVPLARVEANLKKLSRIAPVYFIWGNNDRETDIEQLLDVFKRCGVEVLANRSVELAGNPHVKLVGNDYFGFDPDGLKRSFADVAADDTVIFATHTPFVFEQVEKKYAPHLLLAGHTHGGQIRFGPFGIYEKGSLRKRNGFVELVSNGFGTTHLHLRLGTQGEYHLLHLVPELADSHI